MGNFTFSEGDGYVSPCHNSTYYEEETDEYFIYFHTRFPDRGEEHELRVHQMFFNEDGWPFVAKETLTNQAQESQTILDQIRIDWRQKNLHTESIDKLESLLTIFRQPENSDTPELMNKVLIDPVLSKEAMSILKDMLQDEDKLKSMTDMMSSLLDKEVKADEK